MPWQKFIGVSIGCVGLWSTLNYSGLAQPISPSSQTPATTLEANVDQIVLPPAADVPEEILRTEIIFEARSPLDGTPLSPTDYAQLQAELATAQTTATLQLDPNLDFILLLLQARRAFKPVIPFLP